MRSLAELIDIIEQTEFPIADEELLGEAIAAALDRKLVDCFVDSHSSSRRRTLVVRLEPVDSGKWAEGFMQLPDERWPDRSLDAVVNLVSPRWWWRVGTCFVSDDAAIGPDYNDPRGPGLHQHFPPEHFDGVLDEDLRPPVGIPGICKGMILCLLKARLKKQEITNAT